MTRQIQAQRVRDVMTTALITVSPATTVRELKALFARHDIGAVPVVDEAGALRGVVTTFDFLRIFRSRRSRWFPDLRALWAERADDIMTRGLVTVHADESVVSAIDLMIEYKLRCLPVVERREGATVLVGVVTRKNVLGSLIIEDDDIEDHDVDR